MNLWILYFALLCGLSDGHPSPNFLYEMVLDESMKSDFVWVHNYHRSHVDPPPSNMDNVEWDDELENLARGFVSNCSFEHSVPPLESDTYGKLGENLYSGDEFRYSDIPAGVTQIWFNEKRFYDITRPVHCLPGRECKHYTQLVWAKTSRIGCAIGRCSQVYNGYGRTLVACLYGPSGNGQANELDIQDPYKLGKACSECPDDHPLCADGLCVKEA